MQKLLIVCAILGASVSTAAWADSCGTPACGDVTCDFGCGAIEVDGVCAYIGCADQDGYLADSGWKTKNRSISAKSQYCMKKAQFKSGIQVRGTSKCK